VGLVEPLLAALSGLRAHVHAALVFGSIARGEGTATSDINLMVVFDDLAYPDAYLALEDIRQELGRPINPVICSQSEFAIRARRRDAFVTQVLAQQPRAWLLGDEQTLAA
jgi:predicted nucleotidyltransferase